MPANTASKRASTFMRETPDSFTTSSRARSRNASFVSLRTVASGVPKRTVQVSGIGKNAPRGMLRCRFSRYTGTSSTCGDACASRKSPLLNGPGSASRPRVPSGKMISESPGREQRVQRLERIYRRVLARAVDQHGAQRARRDVLAQPALPQ